MYMTKEQEGRADLAAADRQRPDRGGQDPPFWHGYAAAGLVFRAAARRARVRVGNGLRCDRAAAVCGERSGAGARHRYRTGGDRAGAALGREVRGAVPAMHAADLRRRRLARAARHRPGRAIRPCGVRPAVFCAGQREGQRRSRGAARPARAARHAGGRVRSIRMAAALWRAAVPVPPAGAAAGRVRRPNGGGTDPKAADARAIAPGQSAVAGADRGRARRCRANAR